LAVELFILPGFGFVGISGIILITLGFALLPAYIPAGISPREDYIMALRAFIFGTAITLGSFFGLVVLKVVQVRKKKPVSYTPEGKEGFAIEDIKPGVIGFVKIEGEYWRAVSNSYIKAGERIVVLKLREDGVLVVDKK
ncbi:MAG: NfeD family protein, partial [Desulfurococcaceae archaeon]